MTTDTGPRLATAALLMVFVAGATSAQGDRPGVDRLTRGVLPGLEVELGGVIPGTMEEVRDLFPGQRGLAAHYNGGQEIRVYDTAGEGDVIEHVFARVVDGVHRLDRRVIRFADGQLMVVERHDPATGYSRVLLEEEQLCVAFAGNSGQAIKTLGTWRIFRGVETVTIGEGKHRTARFELQRAAAGDTAPSRRRPGQISTRAQWIDLDTGLTVLEAAWYEGAEAWLPILVLTSTEVIDEEALQDGLAEHLRVRMLGLDARTLPEPEDRLIVPQVAEAEIDPTRVPTLPRERPARVMLLEIIVHTMANGGGSPPRTADDAWLRASRLVRLARKRGVDFGDVARWYSDGSTSRQDGVVGVQDLRAHRRGDPAVKAAFSMRVGQVSEPIRRGAELVIVGRGELVELCAARILVGHRESLRQAPGGRTRTRAQALALLEKIRARITRGGSFKALALQHSDAPEAANGGRLGILAPGVLDSVSEAKLAATPIGQVTEILDGRHGLVILKRLPVERIRAVLVLVKWHPAPPGRPEIELGGQDNPRPTGAAVATDRRTKEEARARGKEIARELRRVDVDAMQIAQEWSDDPRAAEIGGDTGPLDPHLLPPLLAPLAKLEVGGVTDPIETPNGYVVAKRTK